MHTPSHTNGCKFCNFQHYICVYSERINLYSWLKADKLSPNIAKTEFMVISTRQKFLQKIVVRLISN